MRYMDKNGWSNFKLLFEEGVSGELMFKQYLIDEKYTDIIHIDDAIKLDDSLSPSDWDWKANKPTKYGLGEVEKFEVKTQNTCHNYPGVNVETTQSGLESGLALTDADYYIFVNPTLGFGFVPVDTLRELEECGVMKPFATKSNNVATGFILPHNEILWTNEE